MGCASAPAASASAVLPASPTPDWYEEIAPVDVFWGIGEAKLQDPSQAPAVATLRAQRDVAGQLGTLVQSLLTDYYRQAGLINDPAAIQHIESITRGVINQDLSGATVNKRARMTDGASFIRVSLSKSDAVRVINNVADNEAARYADFKRQEALKMLDAEIARTQSKPTVVSADE
jgi:hypothetical protein